MWRVWNSPRDTKQTSDPIKVQRKKRRATRPGRETEVTLTEEELEQIVDVVTLALEDKWLALEEQ